MLTQEQIAAEQARILARLPKRQGRGRPSGRARDMNKTERAYAEHLLARMVDGDVIWFGFECLKIRLANKSWYTADFLVQRPDGSLEIHETKGHMEDDAAVKLRDVAEHWWIFRLFLVRRDGKGGWRLEERER